MSEVESLLDLPSPIMSDILSRLPTKSIVQCRCICKTWLKLLSEKEFATLHLLRSRPCLIIHKLDLDSSSGSCLNLVELEDKSDHHDLSVAEMKLILPYGCGNEGLIMVGSINGLVCLNEFKQPYDPVYLWNPTTRESITVPNPEGELEYPNVVSYGFGLSLKSGHYKVVRIFQELEKSSQQMLKFICQVHALGDGSWRTTRNCPNLFSCGTNGVFLNGNLHWLIHDPSGPEFISSFDLETDSFTSFPAPPELSQDFNSASLGLFGHNLSICDNTSDYEIAIWVLKEDKIKNEKQWTKEFGIEKWPADLHGPSYEVVRILKVFQDGNILLLWRDDILLSYNSNSETLHQSAVHKLINSSDDGTDEGGYPRIEALEYITSFLSLKDFTM